MVAGASPSASRHNSTRERHFSIGLFRTCRLTQRSWTFASDVKVLTPKATALNLHPLLQSRRLQGNFTDCYSRPSSCAKVLARLRWKRAAFGAGKIDCRSPRRLGEHSQRDGPRHNSETDIPVCLINNSLSLALQKDDKKVIIKFIDDSRLCSEG